MSERRMADGEIVVPINEWKLEGPNIAQYRIAKDADAFIKTNEHMGLERVTLLTLGTHDYYGVRRKAQQCLNIG